MTREEALSILKSILADLQRGAKDTDNISCCLEFGFITYGKAKDCIKVLEQEPRWIPVSERLPEAEYGESDSVLVCFEDETQDVLYFNGSNWCYPTGEIYISVNHKNGWHNKVVAWMPKHISYKPQESEKTQPKHTDDSCLNFDFDKVKEILKKDSLDNLIVDHTCEEKQEPKTGRWIDDKCSVCGKGTEDLISSPEWYRNEKPNFCPFCGVKLEREDKYE